MAVSYTIEIKSRYRELWRYNLILSCGGLNSDGELLYVEGAKRVESEEFFAKRSVPMLVPQTFVVNEPLRVECGDAEQLRILIYVIPYLFPEQSVIEECKPFDLSVKVQRLGEVIYDEIHPINCWSGASLDFIV